MAERRPGEGQRKGGAAQRRPNSREAAQRRPEKRRGGLEKAKRRRGCLEKAREKEGRKGEGRRKGEVALRMPNGGETTQRK